jgi:hypothetical protein
LRKDSFDCSDGFAEIARILDEEHESSLKEEFSNLQMAINVLKHGRGRSYEALLTRVDALPFRIRKPDESFFFEGDVSEISTLIDVNDDLVNECGRVIREVSTVMRRRPGGWF